ncbi:Ubiquitin carboxyl-terminal hydrolase [Dirofilaria immitis]
MQCANFRNLYGITVKYRKSNINDTRNCQERGRSDVVAAVIALCGLFATTEQSSELSPQLSNTTTRQRNKIFVTGGCYLM